MPYGLFSPIRGLPWFLLPLWPLIFWRICRLRDWMRANGGPDAEILFGITHTGRVIVRRMSDDLTGRGAAWKPLARPNAALAAAIRGEDSLALFLSGLAGSGLAHAGITLILAAPSGTCATVQHARRAGLPLPDS